MGKKDNYLIISDFHSPYGHRDALKFCVGLMDRFNIAQENVYNVGDFEDQYFANKYMKSPDRIHTSMREIELVWEDVSEWGRAFPLMKMCTSNHGARLYKRALEADLPSVVLRSMRELFKYPKGWELKEEYLVKAKQKFLVCHGEGFSGIQGHIEAARAHGISTAMGHLHGFGGVNHIRTKHMHIWAMNVSCLIDPVSFAFEYGKHHKSKPTLGAGVVLDSGRIPLMIPMEGE